MTKLQWPSIETRCFRSYTAQNSHGTRGSKYFSQIPIFGFVSPLQMRGVGMEQEADTWTRRKYQPIAQDGGRRLGTWKAGLELFLTDSAIMGVHHSDPEPARKG